MSNLSQEDIEREEKMRAEARDKAQKEIEKKNKREKSKRAGIGCLVLLGLFVLLIIVLSSGGSDKPTKTTTPPAKETEEATETPKAEADSQADVKQEATNNKAVEPAKQEAVAPQPEVTLGEKNALKKAQSYLNFTAFSYSGLVEQLEHDGHTHKEAVYGVDNVGANWNEQAAKKAQSYLDFTAFSRQGLIDQLKHDGFTTAQAEYGAKAVGY